MKYALVFAVAMGLSVPAMAQGTTSSRHSTVSKTPTQAQCDAGYKAGNKQWTQAQFNKACASLSK